MIMIANNLDINEEKRLEKEFDIDDFDAREIINIYFECCSHMTYDEFLKKNITVIKDTEENKEVIDLLKDCEDACLFESQRDINRYFILTNTIDIKNMGVI